jgi:hypothetical protein
MIKNAVICDECSSEKRDVNHWWVVKTSGDRPVFMVWPWDSAQNVVDVQHFCGQNCVSTALAKWMSEQVAGEKNGNRN